MDKPDKVKQNLINKMLVVFPLSIIIMLLILFVPAGTFSYWHAWIFICVLFVPFIFVASYLLKHDPALLRRRMQFKEKESEQKAIIKAANLFCCIGFIIPGLDYRYNWSNVPMPIVIIADIIVLIGYGIIFFVFMENSYTSRIIEIDKKQKIITTGPYSKIRHPMYAGIILMFIAIPFALGSYWALAFFIPVIFLVFMRTLNEEEFLKNNLKGYKEYMHKVRYRIIPFIW